MLTADEKAKQWEERRAFDEQWGAEQEMIRRVKSSELVVIDPARFERLLAAARAANAWCDEKNWDMPGRDLHGPVWNLQPGDLDPLP